MKIKIKKHINKQCISFGITYSWNYEYALEIDFLFWFIDITFKEIKKWP